MRTNETPPNPLLEDYRLSRRTGRSDTFIVEGRWPVELCLAASFRVRTVLLVEGQHADLIPLIEGRARLLRASKSTVNELVGFDFHRGVLACAERPSPTSLSDFSFEGFIVVCPEIADESNLGAIIRNAAAFGAAGIALPRNHGADVYSRKAIRASSGSVFRMRVLESMDLLSDVRGLRKRGVMILGTTSSPDAFPIHQVPTLENFALLLGSERNGLAPDWSRECDLTLTIPMSGEIDSLNVACSSAVMMYALTSPQVSR